MGKHSAPRTRSHYAFWSTLGIAGAATIALTLPPTVVATQGEAHASAQVVQELQAADAYGCYWFAAGPAWVSDRTPDGLCHDGPHGKPYWATGAYSGNEALNQAAKASELAERQAAQLIADRLDSGQRLEEDWTWVGMPPVVGAFNDALLDEWEAAGRPDASGWLESYAATVEV
jgi:hypothetical protein